VPFKITFILDGRKYNIIEIGMSHLFPISRVLYSTILNETSLKTNKAGCVFPMVIVSIQLNAEFGRNDHREGAPQFIWV